MDNFRLCYICPRTKFAFFTNAPLDLQWGDDWNDAPYEHNAGDPYPDHRKDGQRIAHEVIRIAWEGPYETPAERAGSNSSWSVQDINRGCIAWLLPGWDATEKTTPVAAGTSLVDFARILKANEGEVYLSEDVWQRMPANPK